MECLYKIRWEILWGLGIFAWFIFPVWTTVHCAIAERSKLSKALWIVFMLVLRPVGSIFYGLLGARRWYFKLVSAALIFLALIAAARFLISTKIESDLARSQADSALARMNSLRFQDVTEQQTVVMKQELRQLKKEAEFRPFSLEGFGRVRRLLVLFEGIAADQVITRDEYIGWDRSLRKSKDWGICPLK